MERWLRNPEEVKPMAPEEVPGRTGIRGMPNLNLTEEQIDQLVAYLKTLK
jgi:mono/diheme cytochrome c family protein